MDSKYIVITEIDSTEAPLFFETEQELIEYFDRNDYLLRDAKVFELGRELKFKKNVEFIPEPIKTEVKKELRTTVNEREKDVKRTTIGAYGAAAKDY